jgi:hypothetical protein
MDPRLRGDDDSKLGTIRVRVNFTLVSNLQIKKAAVSSGFFYL